MDKKVLLYSGGMDSWLIDKLWKPDVKIFFNIGTANSNYELERVKKLDDVVIIDLPLKQFEQADNNYYLPLRNLHFITMAAHYGDVICLGATGSSTHKDKNDVFATLSENVINYLLSEDTTRHTKVKIVLPFRGMSKTEILAKYLAMGGDINKCYEETFSCYSPDAEGKPCMKCTSCLSKFTAFYNNGYQFDDDTTNRFIENVLANPNSKSDTLELAIKLKYGKKTICVDFDNTITTESGFPITGDLRDGCKETLYKWKYEGYRLVLFTARKGIDYINCINFCKQHDLPFDDYVGNKPFYKYMIDDKAISFDTDTKWVELKDII